ncbi:MAG: hypothetical protein WC752_03555 [Patescibacteria group bacterium]|jgi:hypothetical protein
MKKIVLSAMFLSLMIMPFSTFASKQVTQSFKHPFTYLPMKTGAMIFTHEQKNFYYSQTPEIAVDWKKYKLSSTFDSIQGEAVHFKNYTYAIGGDIYNNGYSQDETFDRIIRFKDENPKKIETVITITNESGEYITPLIYNLVSFEDKLYTYTALEELLQSSDGTDWTTVETTGLPNNKTLEQFIATTDTLYARIDNTIYYTKNGADWHKLNRQFSGVTNIMVYKDKLFVNNRNENNESDLFKLKSNHFIKICSNKKGFIDATNSALFLITNTLTDEEISYKIYKSTDGEKFTKVASGENAITFDPMEVNGETLFTISGSENTNTYLLRI